MATIPGLVVFAARQLLDGACAAVGVKESGEAVVGFLSRHLSDHSQRLNLALQEATERAWKALEVALAGKSLLGRMASAEDRQLRHQVRAFLETSQEDRLPNDATTRERALRDLRAARKAGRLAVGPVDPEALARTTGAFARFSDPQALLDAEREVLKGMAQELSGDYPDLARLMELEPQPGRSVLVVGVRFFFRRAVEEDPQLFRGLAFAKLEHLSEGQEQGFSALDALLKQQGQRLESHLGEMRVLVAETHGVVLDLQGQIEGQGAQVWQIGKAIHKLLEQHQLQQRELRPGDSLSIRNDNERQLVKQLVSRYRGLPDADRKKVPALLNAIGKLEAVVGDFDAAQKDFQTVALLVPDTKAQAEAHHNAYLTSLEKRDWSEAVQALGKAVKLDLKRFAPFPVGKYVLKRILGAGGFGVAFLCRHKYLNSDVVVKTLTSVDWGPGAGEVFSEAQVLRELDHPAIIRVSECGYTDPAGKTRPFLVMDFFEGMTLEEYVMEKGRLRVDQLLWVAGTLAEALQAAHAKGILHRDVKPANILVRKDEGRWCVKVIDFGLAIRQKSALPIAFGSSARGAQTLVGRSIAGTAEFAAPEQMGRRDEPVGPYSDVYGWAKVCSYALFQTTQPLRSHWSQLTRGFADLLESCLTEDPARRPQTFATVLERLDRVSARTASGWRCAPQFRSAGVEEEATRATESDDHRLKGRKKREKGNKQRSPFVVWTGAALFGALTVFLVAWMMFRPKPAPAVSGASSSDAVSGNERRSKWQVAGASSTTAIPGNKKRPQGLEQSVTRQVEYPVSPSVKMVFCWIPPGESRLGSPPGEKKHVNHPERGAEDEHVFSTPGFWLGKYEVTQAEWVAMMGRNPRSHNGRNPNSARGMDTSRFPVEDISWQDAQRYIKAMNARGGMDDVFGMPGRFVIPTEDEWEYACRGGRGNADPFYFGKMLNGRQANCDGKKPYGTAIPGPSLGRPTVVGSYAAEVPHPWGLCDMHGNVWEFCDSDRPRPAGTRVLRGGCWSDAVDCRAANRAFFGPDTHHYLNDGMRVCYRPR